MASGTLDNRILYRFVRTHSYGTRFFKLSGNKKSDFCNVRLYNQSEKVKEQNTMMKKESNFEACERTARERGVYERRKGDGKIKMDHRAKLPGGMQRYPRHAVDTPEPLSWYRLVRASRSQWSDGTLLINPLNQTVTTCRLPRALTISNAAYCIYIFRKFLAVNNDYFLKRHSKFIFVMAKCCIFFAARTEFLTINKASFDFKCLYLMIKK
jgi:hypothetical protein